MKTSVIISSINRKDSMLRMFAALAGQTVQPDQVVLIEAGAVEWKKSDLPANLSAEVCFVAAPKSSLAEARDMGQKKALGEVLFFFDDDIILPSTYISDALRYLEDNHHVMAVGGGYNDASTRERSDSSIMIGRLFGIYAGGEHNKLLPSGWADYVRGKYASEITSADWLFGCNFVVRASAFAKARIESRMKAWSFLEDVFFGISLQESFGNCIRILPCLAVIHDPPASGGKIRKATLRMRIVYRYILWREHIAPRNKLSVFNFSLGMVANLLLMIKQEKKFWVVTDSFKTMWFIIKNRDMDWEKANEFVFSRD